MSKTITSEPTSVDLGADPRVPPLVRQLIVDYLTFEVGIWGTEARPGLDETIPMLATMARVGALAQVVQGISIFPLHEPWSKNAFHVSNDELQGLRDLLAWCKEYGWDETGVGLEPETIERGTQYTWLAGWLEDQLVAGVRPVPKGRR